MGQNNFLTKLDFYKRLILLSIFFCQVGFSYQMVFAQEVEHNYKVGPNYVDCDSINVEDLSEYDAIIAIRAGIYRFHQNFRLTRKQGLQMGEFYSCNTIQGYLIIKYNNTELLYVGVEKQTWDELITNQDPEGFYLIKAGQLKKFSD